MNDLALVVKMVAIVTVVALAVLVCVLNGWVPHLIYLGRIPGS